MSITTTMPVFKFSCGCSYTMADSRLLDACMLHYAKSDVDVLLSEAVTETRKFADSVLAAERERCINLARGCFDYSGGFDGKEHKNNGGSGGEKDFSKEP